MEIDDIIEDDDSFEALLADKRHKELLAGFTKIAAAISDDNKGDDKVVSALSQLSRNIEQFILKQKEPKVSVETNQDKVVDSVDDMGQKILQGLQDLMAKVSEKRNYDFHITRDRAGYLELISAKQL
jgi:hypothetical protein